MNTLSNVEPSGGKGKPPGVRFAPDTIPEAISSNTGVSVEYVPVNGKRWYVFRASYGREDRALDYIVDSGTFAYIAKRYVRKKGDGHAKMALKNLVPNILFVYATKEKAEEYVKSTPELSFLSYYYNHFAVEDGKNPPLVIGCREMENFIRATCSHNEHLRFIEESKCRYKSGETVVITDGPFKGVEGKVARVLGQQRVVISISKIGLVSTAYIPTAFIEKLD